MDLAVREYHALHYARPYDAHYHLGSTRAGNSPDLAGDLAGDPALDR